MGNPIDDQRNARNGTMEFGINSQKIGNATDQPSATDLTASASGRTSTGASVDISLSQGMMSQLRTNAGVMIEEAGKQYGVWVSQAQGKAPNVQVIEYDANGTAIKEPVTVNDPVLGAKLSKDVYMSAQDAQYNRNVSGTATVPTKDFDTLAADARSALAEAGITNPPSTGGRTR